MSSLANYLVEKLPNDIPFTFYHLSSPPSICDALFSAPAHSKAERTYREHHLLLACVEHNLSNENEDTATKKHNTTDSNDVDNCEKDTNGTASSTKSVPILAIEVIIYTSRYLTTIFVAKADSTGYFSYLSKPRDATASITVADTVANAAKGRTPSPARTICATFISYLVRQRQRPRTKVVVSLFARAQSQYLFPGSVDNGAKHVLDDRALVKWWCKVLDPLIRQGGMDDGYTTVKEVKGEKAIDNGSTVGKPRPGIGYLIVPGFDAHETTMFFPLGWRADLPDRRRWKCGHPLTEMAQARSSLIKRQLHVFSSLPPRCLIPHFPDDPKARFLDDLDAEIPSLVNSQTDGLSSSPSKRRLDQWQTVKTLDQFWEMMAFRQECSSGRLVGFIWAVFPPADDQDEAVELLKSPMPIPENSTSKKSTSNIQPDSSARLAAAQPQKPKPSHNGREEKHVKRSKRSTLKGPIVPRQPRIKTISGLSTSVLSSSSSSLPTLYKNPGADRAEVTDYYYWPKASRGEVVLSEKDYSRATEMLLRLDFSSLDATIASCKRWTEEIAVLARTNWGRKVVGRMKRDDRTGIGVAVNMEGIADGANGLWPGRKIHDGGEVTGPAVPNGLNASDRSMGKTPIAATQTVNVLDSGFIKKKKKIIPTAMK